MAILDLKIQAIPLWVNTDSSSFKTTLPFPQIFASDFFNVALCCLRQWSACSNSNRSWQPIKEVQHGTQTTIELTLLTLVWLP